MSFDFDPNDQECLKTGFWLFVGVFFGPFILYFFIYLEMLYGPVARVPVFVFLGFLVYKFIQKIVKEYKEAKRILEQNPDCVQGGTYFLPKKGKKYQLMPLKEESSEEISQEVKQQTNPIEATVVKPELSDEKKDKWQQPTQKILRHPMQNIRATKNVSLLRQSGQPVIKRNSLIKELIQFGGIALLICFIWYYFQ